MNENQTKVVVRKVSKCIRSINIDIFKTFFRYKVFQFSVLNKTNNKKVENKLPLISQIEKPQMIQK